MEIGKTIKLLRVASGMSQKDLAHRMDVSTSLISLIETNTREPSLTQLKKISQVFKIPLSLLVFHSADSVNTAAMPEVQEDIERLHDLMLKVFAQILESRDKQND